LLEAIYIEPDSNDLRQIYADWLTEKEDSHGEFISLQLKSATGKVPKSDEKRAASLLAKGWRDWTSPLCDVLNFKSSRFQRGFLSHAFLTGDIRGKPRWKEIFEYRD